jgi:hypothetical protein
VFPARKEMNFKKYLIEITTSKCYRTVIITRTVCVNVKKPMDHINLFYLCNSNDFHNKQGIFS